MIKTKDNSKIKILLLDDDVLLGTALVRELNERGYEASYLSSVHGITETIRAIQPDVLIFDVKIGKENGIEMAQNLYNGNPTLPIIFISSHHTEELKEKGLLQAGAVAYLDKPFSAKLLSAHIDRFTRTKQVNSANDEKLITVGNMLLDIRNKSIIAENGKITELRPMEFNILRKLIASFTQLVSRNDLLYAAWEGQSEYYNEQSLNNYIRRIRNYLTENTNLEIEMYRGIGYKLKESQ